MFEKFDTSARRVIVLSMDHVRRFNHTEVKPEHLMLGGLDEDPGWLISDEAMIARLDQARSALTESAGTPGEARGAKEATPFAPESNRVLEQAMRIAVLDKRSVNAQDLMQAITDTCPRIARIVSDVKG